LGKRPGKGSPELEASGKGKQSVCKETRLLAEPRAATTEGSPKFEASDGGKQSVCQVTRLSAASSVRCGRRDPAITVPERSTQGSAESRQRGNRHTLSTSTTVIHFLHGVVSQLFWAEG